MGSSVQEHPALSWSQNPRWCHYSQGQDHQPGIRHVKGWEWVFYSLGSRVTIWTELQNLCLWQAWVWNVWVSKKSKSRNLYPHAIPILLSGEILDFVTLSDEVLSCGCPMLNFPMSVKVPVIRWKGNTKYIILYNILLKSPCDMELFFPFQYFLANLSNTKFHSYQL